MPGNQYVSKKLDLLGLLHSAKYFVRHGDAQHARWYLSLFNRVYATVPASTRRRWKCGR